MSVLAAAIVIGDTQVRIDTPLSGVGSGNFNVKIDDELLHVGGVEHRNGLTLAMSYAATETHSQGATVTPVLDAYTVNTSSPFAVGGDPGEQTVYVQATDPGAVGAGKLWVDTTGVDILGSPWVVVKIRNPDNDAWTGLFDSLAMDGALDVATRDAVGRLRRLSADGSVIRTEWSMDSPGGDTRFRAFDEAGTLIAEWEVSTDGLGALVQDELGTPRVVLESAAGDSGDTDARYELIVRDAASADKARFRLDETGIELEGDLNLTLTNAPELPASPTEQDIVDALLALGLVTQAP